MSFETRFTWEKLLLELKVMRNEDFGALVPLCIGVQSVIWPDEPLESCFRTVQFMSFEIQKACEGRPEGERWESLRRFLFEEKGFQLSALRPNEVVESDLLLNDILHERVSHPLPFVFLLLHLADQLDLPIALIQARHHFLLKWVRSGKTIYLDLYNEGRALNEAELVQVLNRSSSNLEVWNSRQLMSQYLELLMHTFERTQNLNQLHLIYNLLLQVDDTNVEILGQRALLRQRLGFMREARADLKRYFSFVDRGHAPADIQRAWTELEHASEPPTRGPCDLLH